MKDDKTSQSDYRMSEFNRAQKDFESREYTAEETEASLAILRASPPVNCLISVGDDAGIRIRNEGVGHEPSSLATDCIQYLGEWMCDPKCANVHHKRGSGAARDGLDHYTMAVGHRIANPEVKDISIHDILEAHHTSGIAAKLDAVARKFDFAKQSSIHPESRYCVLFWNLRSTTFKLKKPRVINVQGPETFEEVVSDLFNDLHDSQDGYVVVYCQEGFILPSADYDHLEVKRRAKGDHFANAYQPKGDFE